MGKATKPRKTDKYTNEFKVKAVQLSCLENVTVQDIAQALDIHPGMLSRWRVEKGDKIPNKFKPIIEN